LVAACTLRAGVIDVGPRHDIQHVIKERRAGYRSGLRTRWHLKRPHLRPSSSPIAGRALSPHPIRCAQPFDIGDGSSRNGETIPAMSVSFIVNADGQMWVTGGSDRGRTGAIVASGSCATAASHGSYGCAQQRCDLGLQDRALRGSGQAAMLSETRHQDHSTTYARSAHMEPEPAQARRLAGHSMRRKMKQGLNRPPRQTNRRIDWPGRRPPLLDQGGIRSGDQPTRSGSGSCHSTNPLKRHSSDCSRAPDRFRTCYAPQLAFASIALLTTVSAYHQRQTRQAPKGGRSLHRQRHRCRSLGQTALRSLVGHLKLPNGLNSRRRHAPPSPNKIPRGWRGASPQDESRLAGQHPPRGSAGLRPLL